MSQTNTQQSFESKFEIDVSQMMQNNPQVDVSLVTEATRMLKSLQQNGISPAQYGLSHPFTKIVAVSNTDDTKTIPISD